MTALIIIGVILGAGLLIYLGYYLWRVSMDSYGYNIFNWGVVIRGLLSIACFGLAIGMFGEGDGSTMVWIIVF